MYLRLRHALATSSSPWAVRLRRLRRGLLGASLPLPRVVTVPYRVVFTVIRGGLHGLRRVLVAEPIFSSYCSRVGRGLRTDMYVHFVEGAGVLVVGENVTLDGKSSIRFAARFTDSPTLTIGDRTGIGHGCTFVIAERITIGNDCRIAAGATFRDSPGHPLDPEGRRRGDPPPAEAVRPIVVEDNVWIGARAMVMPGVRIGRDSVISSGAVVMSDLAPGSLAAGNPARRIGTTYPAPAPDAKEQ